MGSFASAPRQINTRASANGNHITGRPQTETTLRATSDRLRHVTVRFLMNCPTMYSLVA